MQEDERDEGTGKGDGCEREDNNRQRRQSLTAGCTTRALLRLFTFATGVVWWCSVCVVGRASFAHFACLPDLSQ